MVNILSPLVLVVKSWVLEVETFANIIPFTFPHFNSLKLPPLLSVLGTIVSSFPLILMLPENKKYLLWAGIYI